MRGSKQGGTVYNRIFKIALYLSTAVIAVGAIPSTSFAADSDNGQAGARKVEEIVVTARRIAERLQDVPISITVFNQQQLHDRNVVSATDLATYTPSLSTNQQFGTDNSSFTIRGFTQEYRTTPSVAVYFADVVAPRGGGTDVTAGDGAGPGAFFDLQNVQVLKGPQGTLFGRNTTGGAVLLVPNKPTDEWEGYVEASAGNYGMQRVQGVLNAPLSDNVRLRLGFDEQTRDGYLNNISGIGPSHFANVNYYAFRASLVADITPNLENYTIATFSRSDNNTTINQVFACNKNALLAAYFYNAFDTLGGTGPCTEAKNTLAHGYWTVDNPYPDPESLSQQWQVINTTTWHLNDSLTIKNIASYAQFRSDFYGSQFGENFSFPSSFPLSSLLAGTHFDVEDSNRLAGTNTNDQSTLTEELQFQGNWLDNRLIWQAGGYVEVSDPLAVSAVNSAGNANCKAGNTFPEQCYNTFGLLIPIFGEFVNLGGNVLGEGTIAYHNLAGYGQATYSITDQLKLTGGFRYTSDLTKGMGEQIVYNFPPDPTNPTAPPPNTPTESCGNPTASLANNCRMFFRQHSHAPTWVVDLEYTPVQDVMLYAKYSRGYRQGSVTPYGAPDYYSYQPERVDAYEVGAKTSFNGMVPGTANIAAFYNDFNHQQLQVGIFNEGSLNFAVPPTTGIANVGKSRIEGLEAESTLFPFGERFRLDLSGTYLSTKLISAGALLQPGGGLIVSPTYEVGSALPVAPAWKASVTGTYTLPVPDSLGKVSVGANFSFTSKMASSAPAATPLYNVKSSNQLNLFADWDAIDGSPVSASFFMTNVTNYKTENWVSGLYSFYGFEARQIGLPRMFGFRLRYDFGG